MTARAGRWATCRVGAAGRTVAEVVRELGADWPTVNDTVIAFGRTLVEHRERFNEVTALGLMTCCSSAPVSIAPSSGRPIWSR